MKPDSNNNLTVQSTGWHLFNVIVVCVLWSAMTISAIVNRFKASSANELPLLFVFLLLSALFLLWLKGLATQNVVIIFSPTAIRLERPWLKLVGIKKDLQLQEFSYANLSEIKIVVGSMSGKIWHLMNGKKTMTRFLMVSSFRWHYEGISKYLKSINCPIAIRFVDWYDQ